MPQNRFNARRNDALERISRTPAPIVAYDAANGQMYTEQSVQVKSRHHSDWIGELRTPSLATKASRLNDSGARSLVDAAVIKVAEQLFGDLCSDHFKDVPWGLAEKLWMHVLATNRESFHTWRVMASAYPEQMSRREYRYCINFRQPSLALPDYFSAFKSQDWLTCLRLSPKEMRTADLINVAKIPNLAVLDLSDGQISFDNLASSPFDERVFRTWAGLSAAAEGFAHLEALLLGWQSLGMWIFQYLPAFPALTKVIVTDSPHLHQKNRKAWESTALSFGWEARHAKRSAKSLRPVLDEPMFHRCAVSGIMSQFSSPGCSQAEPSCACALPVVEACLGTPKKWTHILEDFPGTRTIYFDRVKVLDQRSYPRDLWQGEDDAEAVRRNGRPERSHASALLPSKRVLKTASQAQRNAVNFSEILG